jgi:hypothetical protein
MKMFFVSYLFSLIFHSTLSWRLQNKEERTNKALHIDFSLRFNIVATTRDICRSRVESYVWFLPLAVELLFALCWANTVFGCGHMTYLNDDKSFGILSLGFSSPLGSSCHVKRAVVHGRVRTKFLLTRYVLIPTQWLLFVPPALTH